jgi:hypothetical protein
VTLPTIIPSEGVQPYQFGKVNVGTGIGKALKKGATTALKMRNIKAQHNVDKLQTETKGLDGEKILTGAIPNVEAAKAGVDKEITRQEEKTRAKGIVPARTKKKVGGALRKTSGVLSQAQAESFGKNPVTGQAASDVAQLGERIAPTAVQTVTAARKKAKQVRPKKETSLTVKSL